MEHTYDSVGQKKEVIVIDDSQTPEHPPRKRTRAQVAAENAAIASGRGSYGNGHGHAHGHGQNGHLYNGASAHSVASTSSAGKKRKVDEGTDSASKKKGKAAVSISRQPSDLN
jgi:dual-specificity kinase